MTDTGTPQLEQQLAELTTWTGSAPGLWRRALGSAQAAHVAGRASTVLRRPVPRWLIGTLAAAALVFIAVIVSLPSLWGVRKAATRAAHETPPPAQMAVPYASGDAARQPASFGHPFADLGTQATFGPASGGRVTSAETRARVSFLEGGAQTRTDLTIERQVVRKATIELKAKDVRAAFLMASQLLSEAGGEYIQDSSITGEGVHPEANLTLRVAAERLPEVLNELRQLGEVRMEKVTGEDVTGQVVDLEARLRNEQRVETELLALLESRKDSPLKEILELRGSISAVRQTIEHLTAQRERLGRLVSLATVLVIIRPADATPPVAGGAWADLASALRHSVRDGVHFLTRTLATLVSIVIGGLIWWVLAAIGVIVTVRAYRRRAQGPA